MQAAVTNRKPPWGSAGHRPSSDSEGQAKAMIWIRRSGTGEESCRSASTGINLRRRMTPERTRSRQCLRMELHGRPSGRGWWRVRWRCITSAPPGSPSTNMVAWMQKGYLHQRELLTRFTSYRWLTTTLSKFNCNAYYMVSVGSVGGGEQVQVQVAELPIMVK